MNCCLLIYLFICLFIYLFIYLQYLFITYLFLFQETVSISSLEFGTALYPLTLESSGAYEPQYRTQQYDINN